MVRRIVQSAVILSIFVLATAVILLARAQTTSQKPTATTTASKSDTLAEVDGVAITDEEIEKALSVQLNTLQEQIYNLKRQKLDAEVTSKVGLVTEQEIETYYQKNKAQFGDAEESAAKNQIRTGLQSEKINARRQAFLQTLRSQAKVAVYLTPPAVYRAAVSLEGARFRGPAAAPVTIVEFSDFHCPYCKGVERTLAQILSRYGEKVRLAFKDFPIDSLHPQARPAHEAARCAGEPGKFWEYQKLLFDGTPKSGAEQLKAVAQQAGLGLPTFEQCVNSGKYKAVVQKDIAEGRGLQVTGTPAFFINGRFLSGAQPLGSFARVIDDELARGAAGTAGSQ